MSELKGVPQTRGRSASTTPLVFGGRDEENDNGDNNDNSDDVVEIDLNQDPKEDDTPSGFFPKLGSYFKLFGSEDDIAEPPDEEVDPAEHNVFLHQLFTYARYTLSSVLTLSYLAYLLWGIWTGQAVLPGPPVAHFLIFVFCLVLVAYLEGLQIAILALEKESPEKKRLSHTRAYKLITSVKKGNNVERFLVGRQFFTIFIMTLMAQVTSFPLISHLGISPIVWFIFIQTGLPGAVVVTTIGSLQSQLLSAKDPWQFLDLYGSFSVLKLCYASEVTGICTHFAWLLIGIFRRTVFVTCKPPKPRRELSRAGEACEALKYILSTVVVLTYTAYLMYGIWTNQAILPLPEIGVFCTLALCFVCLSLLEGLQVAILVTENTDPETFRTSHPRAYALMKKATFEKNVRRFLIGRQFFVIFIVFLVNQCTIFPRLSYSGINDILWLVLVQLGLPTALTVLCFAQLPAQLLANQDALMFMNRYGARLTLEVCLLTEKTGLAHFSWVVTSFSKATWFRINVTKLDEIVQYKDLEMMKGGRNRVNMNTTNTTGSSSRAVVSDSSGSASEFVGSDDASGVGSA